MTKLNGVKIPLYNWRTFWMAPYLICYFVVILFIIERKWLFMRTLNTVLPLKSKLCGAIVVLVLEIELSKCWKIVEFPKISIKMKNCKTFYEAQTTSRLKEIIQPLSPPHSDKILQRLWRQIFLRICKEI